MGSVFVAAQTGATVDGNINITWAQVTNTLHHLQMLPSFFTYNLNCENVLTKVFTSSLFLDTAELLPAQAPSYQDGHLAGIDIPAQSSQPARIIWQAGHGVS